MIGIENLSHIRDRASVENIHQMTDCFVRQVDPLQVILFGSFADGTYTDSSDYDFYIVVDDGRSTNDASFLAYKAVRGVKQRPVDIVVGTKSRFEKKGRSVNTLMVEGEVFKKGILLYDRQNQVEKVAAI